MFWAVIIDVVDDVYLTGRKKRGRPHRRFSLNVVKEDMQRMCVLEEDSRVWVKWRQKICCADP